MDDPPPEPDPSPTSLFTRTADGIAPTGLARSPWTADALHGGPVAALLAQELESLDGSEGFFPARLTIELHRPVTFGPHQVRTRVVRPGRRVRVVEAELVRAGDDAVVARATAQQIEMRAVELPDDLEGINGPERRPPSPEQLPHLVPEPSPADDTGGLRFHADAVEHRAEEAVFGHRGRVTDWIRVTADLLPDTPLSRFGRVAAAADFGNGISAVLPFDDYVFINPDLSIHLFRLPIDEWVCLDAVTRIGLEPGNGSVGLAESVLFDRRGRFGRALQSLLVVERS
jgi:hypothetical protein